LVFTFRCCVRLFSVVLFFVCVLSFVSSTSPLFVSSSPALLSLPSSPSLLSFGLNSCLNIFYCGGGVGGGGGGCHNDLGQTILSQMCEGGGVGGVLCYLFWYSVSSIVGGTLWCVYPPPPPPPTGCAATCSCSVPKIFL